MNKSPAMFLVLVAICFLSGCVHPHLTPLSQAITRGDVNAVKDLLNKGANPCADEASPYGEAKWAPITFALEAEAGYSCRDELYQALLAKALELLNKRSPEELQRCSRLLDWAVAGGCNDLVRKLLENNYYNSSAPTAVLGTAAYRGHWETAKLLVEKGADPDSAIVDLNKMAADQSPYLEFPRNKKIYDKTKLGIELLNRLAARRPTAVATEALHPAAVTPAVLSQEKAAQIVAVFDVADPAGQLDESTLVQLTGYLATSLVQTGRYKTIPRDQLRARLAEQKKESYRLCMDEACQIELGRSVAAQKSLATQLLKVGAKCALTANLYDLKTETAEKGAVENTGCSKDELLAAMARLAKLLAAP